MTRRGRSACDLSAPLFAIPGSCYGQHDPKPLFATVWVLKFKHCLSTSNEGSSRQIQRRGRLCSTCKRCSMLRQTTNLRWRGACRTYRGSSPCSETVEADAKDAQLLHRSRRPTIASIRFRRKHADHVLNLHLLILGRLTVPSVFYAVRLDSVLKLAAGRLVVKEPVHLQMVSGSTAFNKQIVTYFVKTQASCLGDKEVECDAQWYAAASEDESNLRAKVPCVRCRCEAQISDR